MRYAILAFGLLATSAMAQTTSQPQCPLGDRMWSCEPDGSNPSKTPQDANGNTVTVPTKKRIVEKCDPPKRWIEVDALSADAGRPSKVVCK